MPAPADTQERVIRHGEGPLLVVGDAGTGKTEALARRLVRLAELDQPHRDGDSGKELGPERVLLFTSTRATARRLRARVESLLNRPYEELWIGAWETLGERLLREHAAAAGLDPFFDVVGPAERLAMLLDRFDELPLRRHEIRGNPAGLLALLLQQIDVLKAGSAPPDAEFAELYAAHDRILAAAGSLDRGDVFLTLSKLLAERADVRAEIAERFHFVMVDELEETTPAQRAILAGLDVDNQNHLYALEEKARTSSAAAWFHDLHPDLDTVVLERQFRDPPARFWRCSNERAQAQAVARETEHLLATGGNPEAICILIDEPAARGGAVAAAMEERGIPFHLGGPIALFHRPEVRDMIAWLRVLADPDDLVAATRALTRPPIELRSADMARLAVFARRRKLDAVAACREVLGGTDFPPEAREQIQAFLRHCESALAVMEERRADVFVRRLIERLGLRRQRLYAAEPEVAERLRSLSRLAALAASWARREPHGSTRDFVRYLNAVAEAEVEPNGGEDFPSPGAVLGLSFAAVKGKEFDHVFVLGLEREADAMRIGRPARASLVLSRVERDNEGEERGPSPFYLEALAAAETEEELHEEELFGPAEELHATYRMLREEVLEESWKAGRALSELRLDTAVDVSKAVAHYLELLKLAALAQRPGNETVEDAIIAVNDLLRQIATPEQQAELEASSLDSYLLGAESEHADRRKLIAAHQEPSLEAFIPRRGDGALSLSASDISLYRTCPLKYKFARVFGIPQEATINQRFGILIHNVLERFHKEMGTEDEHGLQRLMRLFEAGWRRSGFGSSDDELQFRDRAREAMRLYWKQELKAEGKPVWLERKFDFRVGEHQVRGRVDRIDRLPSGDHELIDYKTGERKSDAEMESDLQLALYRLAAREVWDLEAGTGSYYYVLDAEKVEAPGKPDDAERVTQTVMQVGEGVLREDFEAQPSPQVCSWCDFRLICPASES